MLSIGAFNALVEDTGRAAGVCYFYSGDYRGAQDSQSRFYPGVRDMILNGSPLRPLQTGLQELMDKEQVEVEEKAAALYCTKWQTVPCVMH